MNKQENSIFFEVLESKVDEYIKVSKNVLPKMEQNSAIYKLSYLDRVKTYFEQN